MAVLQIGLLRWYSAMIEGRFAVTYREIVCLTATILFAVAVDLHDVCRTWAVYCSKGSFMVMCIIPARCWSELMFGLSVLVHNSFRTFLYFFADPKHPCSVGQCRLESSRTGELEQKGI